VKPLLKDDEDAYLIVDDSVQNKQYSRKIELVKKQYSWEKRCMLFSMTCSLTSCALNCVIRISRLI
jgi:hypothetical protein